MRLRMLSRGLGCSFAANLEDIAGLCWPRAIQPVAPTATAEGLFFITLLLATAASEAPSPAADYGHCAHV